MPNARRLALPLILMLLAALVVPSGSVLAGTTGSLTGTINDVVTGAPLTGAAVTIVSPSESEKATTDANGSFVFLSLAPDTYTLTATKAGYLPVTGAGITINADQALRINYGATKTLQTIGNVRSRAGSSLVRAGATTDTYSVNAATQERITGLGGGGSLNQAYSALAATPGVFVPAGQNGWSQSAGVVIRGGTHSQIGYEFDGIPVNVSVNGFPGNNLSTLGQQEAQVYAGSAPANSESQGLSGFINQVIKTGTYPGAMTFDGGFGTPSFYHKLSAEFSGSTKDRSFTYYAGTIAANQAFRVVDNTNGASFQNTYGYGYDVQPCAGNPNNAACFNGGNGLFTPGGLELGSTGFKIAPVSFLTPAYQQDRESIVNLHFGLPHKKDGGRDDVQLLYQTGNIGTDITDSANDLGVAPYPYPVSNVYNGGVGMLLPSNYASLAQKYYFPNAPLGGSGLISPTLRDQQQNGQSIAKVQYQHNMGSNAYLRVYGYSLYSYFIFNSPNGASSPASNFLGEPPDYRVWTHTNGYAAEFADQLNSRNLLQLQGSFTHAPSVRDNSTTWITGGSTPFAYAVDSTSPTSGLCYNVAGGVATPAACAKGVSTNVTYNNAAAPPSLAGATCGGGPCAYYVAENGYQGAVNTVKLDTTAASISDQWKPTDRITVDLGVKFHNYHIIGADTTGPARTFWFNAYNQDFCVRTQPGNTPVSKTSLGLPVSASCSAANGGGVSYMAPGMTNLASDYTFTEWEPRLGATFTVDPNTVIRASYGKYTQPPPTAFEQYNTHQQNLAAYLANRFYRYGYTGSGHNIPPQESYNTDLSLEHAFKGDVSFKVSPFYRKTRNELTEFFIDPANQLTSGLPVGSLTSQGVEFQLRKGSFERDGLSALLSYTYTNARIRYGTLPGGGTILTPINNDIKTYNAYTSFCASHTGDPRCGTTNAASGLAAPCFTTAGIPDPACAAGSIANPYWNAPAQNLLDSNGSYIPTDPVVATTGLGINGYTVPHVLTLVLNYRKKAFAITPSLQLQAGQRYGAPEANAGIDPAGGCAALAATTANDPRYPYGGAGSSYDAVTCGAALNAIPNVYTKSFDSIGQFTSPTQLLGSLTVSYEFNKRLGLTVTAANIINQCFGGSQAPWTGAASPHVCSYISGEISRINAPTGNAYNPGAPFQTLAQYPYTPYLGAYTMGVVNPSAPFAIYADLRLKL